MPGLFTTRVLDSEGFARLATGAPPSSDIELSGSPIAPLDVLAMLAGIADGLRGQIDPNAWIVLDGARVVALCSITSLAEPGVPVIGYGTAPGEEGRGAASAAVASVLEWARGDARISAVAADTSTANPASQRVLERNGFAVTGERVDEEDGPLLCWRWSKR